MLAAQAEHGGFTVCFMTYWAIQDHLRDAGRVEELAAIDRECVAALQPIRDAACILVAGVIGPRADGYRAGASMDVKAAIGYHTAQDRASDTWSTNTDVSRDPARIGLA